MYISLAVEQDVCGRASRERRCADSMHTSGLAPRHRVGVQSLSLVAWSLVVMRSVIMRLGGSHDEEGEHGTAWLDLMGR